LTETGYRQIVPVKEGHTNEVRSAVEEHTDEVHSAVEEEHTDEARSAVEDKPHFAWDLLAVEGWESPIQATSVLGAMLVGALTWQY